MTLFKNILRKFKSNERGAITLEMIILLPLLVLWIVGSNSFFDAFKTYLRASKATYTAVDLISRQNEIGPSYMTNVGSVFRSIVDADGANATVIISSIRMTGGSFDTGGTLELDWSLNGAGGTGLTSAGQIPLAYIPNLLEGEYTVLIQTNVPFIPIYSWGNLTAKTFSNTVAVTPRFDVRVSMNPAL